MLHQILQTSVHYTITNKLLGFIFINGTVALQELSQWRSQKEEESLKNAVLDDVAAARFSTAAALAARRSAPAAGGAAGIDWRTGSLTASPPRGQPERERTPEPPANLHAAAASLAPKTQVNYMPTLQPARKNGGGILCGNQARNCRTGGTPAISWAWAWPG